MQDIEVFYVNGILTTREVEVSTSLLAPLHRHLDFNSITAPKIDDLKLRPSLSLNIIRILQAFSFLHK